MILSRADLELYLKEDMGFYRHFSKKEKLLCRLTNDPICQVDKYLVFLRKEEYYANCSKGKTGQLLALWYSRKKNRLGNKIGFKIPRNTFEEGLTIYHHGGIIINEKTRVGKYAVLHGNNCLGNNGKNDENPLIGDYLDLGVGGNVIGPVKLGDHITIGANAVVTHSFPGDDLVLAGIPAVVLKKRDVHE